MHLESLRREDVMELADSAQIFHQGEEDRESGAIYQCSVSPSGILAKVRDKQGDWTVAIDNSTETLEMDCDCPYKGYVCQHMVAVLLLYIEGGDEKIEPLEPDANTPEALRQTVSAMSHQQLVELVLGLAEEREEVMRALLAAVAVPSDIIQQQPQNLQKVTQLKGEIALFFEKLPELAQGEAGGESQWDHIWAVTKLLNPSDQVEVLGYAIAYGNETVGDFPEIGPKIEQAIAHFATAAVLLSPHQEEKREYLNALIACLDWPMCRYPHIADAVKNALETICTVPADYRYLISYFASSKRPEAAELIPRYYLILGDDANYLRYRQENLDTEAEYLELAEYWKQKGNQGKYLETLEAWILHLLRQEQETAAGLSWFYPTAALERLGILPFLVQPYQTQLNDQNLYRILLALAEQKPVTLELYQQIQTLATRALMWPKLQQILLERAAENPQELARIHMKEQNWEGAIQLARANLDSPAIAIMVAESMRLKNPQGAIVIYQELVQGYIDQKSRDKYRAAADCALAMKSIYLDILHDRETWQQYIDSLSSRYQNRRALKEEFQALLV